MSHLCDTCGKTFANKSNLSKHATTAKYCLELRGKKNTKHRCEYCSRVFSRKHHLDTHLEVCSERKLIHTQKVKDVKTILYKKKNTKLRKQLEEAKDLSDHFENLVHVQNKRIRELELQLARGDGQMEAFERGFEKGAVVARPNHTTMNSNLHLHPKLVNIPVNNIQPLTENYVRSEIAQKYTYEKFLGAEPELADFIIKLFTLENVSVVEEINDDLEDVNIDDVNIEEFDIKEIVQSNQIVIGHINPGLERNYACTDSSRNKFYRLVESKMWEIDSGGMFLHKIFDELAGVATDHYKTLMQAERSAKTKEERDDIHRLIEKIKNMYYGFAPSIGPYRDSLFADIRGRIKKYVVV